MMVLNRIKKLIALFFFLGSFQLLGQYPFKLELVKDINPTGDSRWGDFVEMNGLIYFSGNDGVHGSELWVSDGTEEGTYMVHDINPNEGVTLLKMQVLNGALMFLADDGTHGEEWWRSDGTDSGTYMITDFMPNAAPNTFDQVSNIIYLDTYENEIYFNAHDAVHGFELWKTDGTTIGTQLVADLNPIPWSMTAWGESHTNGMVYGNKFYFSATDSIHGYELWCIDSSNAIPFLLKDINPQGDAKPEFLAIYKNQLFFSAIDSNGRELWVTDGTTNGTQMFANINVQPSGFGNGSSMPFEFTELGDYMYFSARSEGIIGYDLFRTNGQFGHVEHVELEQDLQWSQNNKIVFNNRLYFNGATPDYGMEPWYTDGTKEGTFLLADIDTHRVSGINWSLSSNPGHFFEFNGHLFFNAEDSYGVGRQIWVTNKNHDWVTYLKGTEEVPYGGARRFSVEDQIVIGDYCYFMGNYDGYGWELWRMSYDSTLLGTNTLSGMKSGMISLYPNPVTSNFVTLEYELEGNGKTTVLIYDLTGKVIFTSKSEDEIGMHKIDIPVGNLNSGMYIVQLNILSGTHNLKLIK